MWTGGDALAEDEYLDGVDFLPSLLAGEDQSPRYEARPSLTPSRLPATPHAMSSLHLMHATANHSPVASNLRRCSSKCTRCTAFSLPLRV